MKENTEKELEFTELTINLIALDLQDDFLDDIINLSNDLHRNKVRTFLQIKGYPTNFINKYMLALYARTYKFLSDLINKKY